MADRITINVGKDFSRFPVGRYLADGDSNGERFREQCLRPALVRAEKVEIVFDDALGYGSSFLEEAFGGLVRNGYSAAALLAKLILTTGDDSLREEVEQYIRDAAK
jgi:hypothetical protein